MKAMLESTEKGGVRNSIQNCLTVFQHDPILSGAVAKNLLTERIDLLKPIGRKRRTGSKAMTDTDMKYIRLYLEKTYGLTSEKKIADAADLAADANSYHPIRDYLNGLVWDGKERIRYCLRHFLGADTDNYTFQSLRLFLLGAIHRAFCPGCKFEVLYHFGGKRQLEIAAFVGCHGFRPYLFDIGSGSGFIVQNVYFGPFGVDHDRQEAPVPGTVKGQEVQGVGSPAEHALPQPVLRVGFIGDFIDLLLAT